MDSSVRRPVRVFVVPKQAPPPPVQAPTSAPILQPEPAPSPAPQPQPPPPPPPLIPVSSVQPVAASILDDSAVASVLEQSGAGHIIPNWPWDRTRQPLAPDGVLWDDPLTKTRRHTLDDGPYNAEYFEEHLLRKTLVNYVDLWFQFVTLVAGHLGRGTTAQQFWTAQESGGRAIETIFTNLDLLRPATEGARGEAALKHLEDVAKHVFSTQDARTRDAEQLGKQLPAFGTERAKRLATAAQLAPQLKALQSIPGGDLIVSQDLLRQLGAAAASNAPSGTGAAFTGGPVPAVSQDDRDFYTERIRLDSTIEEYELRMNREIDVAVGRAAGSGTPQQQRATQEEIRLLRQRLANDLIRLRDIKERIDRERAARATGTTRPQTLPTVSTGAEGTAAAAATPNVRLQDGSYLDDINDPKLTLLRMLFREGRAITESELKAWDTIFYDAQYFALAKARAAESDPDTIRKRIELARTVDRMLRGATESGVGWREDPSNVGALFTTPDFQAGLQSAFDRIRYVSAVQDVPRIDLMTHERVRGYFAELVASFIRTRMPVFAGRGTTATAQSKTDSDIDGLVNAFKQLGYDSDGFLCFRRIHNSLAVAERKVREVQRRQHLERTGRHFSDAYPADAQQAMESAKRARHGQLQKKPVFGEFAERERQLNRAALMRVMP